MPPLSRRKFLKTSAVAGAAAALSLGSGCSVFADNSTGKPKLVKIYPEVPRSLVVHTHHSGVWSGDALQPAVLTLMLDASITRLTGLSDPLKAWKALFHPKEKIAIKINTISGSITGTHPTFLQAVLERLKAAGFPDEQIFVYDRDTWEITFAGFKANKDGPGVSLRGTDGHYTEGFKVMDKNVKLSDHLLACDALINLPILKQHMYTGISFAMKNHYGTFDSPTLFHSPEEVRTGLPELNALTPIKDKTRLIIGDALDVVLGNNWDKKVTGDSIFMSFDPVAHDASGFKLWSDTVKQQGKDDAYVQSYAGKANPWLAHAVELGLGASDPAKIELVEQSIG